MNKKAWYLDELTSGLEKLGVTCKDSNGNWRATEDILQEIAANWDNTKDLIEDYFHSKEE